jgi:hypothetical protein
MQVSVNIMLGPEETLDMNADEIAAAVLNGLGGDPSKDMVSSVVSQQPSTGFAGTMPPPTLPDPNFSPPAPPS